MPHKKGPRPETVERIAYINGLLDAGWTLQRVADHLGITRQRVHQIVRRRPDGTSYMAPYEMAARDREREAEGRAKWQRRAA